MLLRIPAVKIAAAIAAMLALSIPAVAQDMKGMDMSGHDMSQMSSRRNAGSLEHERGRDGGDVRRPGDGSRHAHGHGDMKNMSLHMAFTALRPQNDADKRAPRSW